MNSQQMRKEKVMTLKRSRAEYASAITRKLHTLENPMLDDTEFEQVATSIEGVDSSFATTHNELMLNLAYDWEEAEKARELYRKVEAQMKDLYHMIEARKADNELVQFSESASSSLSGHTAHSSQSRRSTTSSRLIKARAKQTKKELRLKQLQQQQQIERERDELKRRAELQKAEYEIEEARINAQLEEELETRSCKSKSQNSTNHEPLRPVSSSQDTTYHELPQSDPLASNSYIQHKHKLISVNCDSTNKSIHPTVKYISQAHETESQGFPRKPQCDISKPASQSQCLLVSRSTLNPTANEWNPTTSNEPTIQPQERSRDDSVNMYVAMASAVRESFMIPKPEILTFNGDPVMYYKFIRCFETHVQDRISDSSLRLSYVIQYCTGEAKESIEDCVIQEPTEGYQRARKILEKRYGRPHIIARSYPEAH